MSFNKISIVAVIFIMFAIFYFQSRLGRRFKSERNQKKAVTTLWAIIAYSFLYCVEALVVYNYNYRDFEYPLCIFDTVRLKCEFLSYMHDFCYFHA